VAKLSLIPPVVGRFDLVQIDGWLDDIYVDDLVGEDAWIEIAADGSGEFQIGDVEGVLFVLDHTEDSIRWRWCANWCGDGLVGTGSVSLFRKAGVLFGVLRCRGEEQPWGFTAERRGAPEVEFAPPTADSGQAEFDQAPTPASVFR